MAGSADKLNAARRMFLQSTRSPGFDRDWNQFLNRLIEAIDEREPGEAQVGTPTTVQTQAPQGGGGAPNQGNASGASRSVLRGFEAVRVRITGAEIPTGALVHYAGSRLVRASATTVPANFAVGGKESGFYLLYQVWASGLLLLEDASSVTPDADGALYLAFSGGVTGSRSRLETVDQYGYPTPVEGVRHVQQAGWKQSLISEQVPGGFVRCSLNLYSPIQVFSPA